MPSTAPTVAVEGFSALQRDLKKMGDPGGQIAQMTQALAGIVAQPVMTRTKAAWPAITGAHRDSVRIVRVKTGATIVEGGSADKYGGTGWLEFGGSLHGGERSGGHLPGGRWLFPAAKGLADQVAQRYSAGMQAILDNAASWTNTTTDPGGVSD